ncbi:MAG: FkbM family methyltransferase [Nitrososphaerota archaeon]
MMIVKLKNIIYNFYLARKSDSNVYLNPYFHEHDVVSFVINNLKEGDVFIDIGAHCGLYTIVASKRVGIEGMVVSVEPNPENVRYLIRNIKINDLKNVIIIAKALGQRKERIKMFYHPGATALTSVKERGHFKWFRVDQVTLDDIVEELKLGHIKMIKIDTEGYDEHVLRGGGSALQKTDYVIVELNTNNVRELLLRKGFDLYMLHPSRYILAIKRRMKINESQS